MSFASDVKTEIAAQDLKPCCARAQTAAYIQQTGSLSIHDQKQWLTIRSEQPMISRRIYKLLKQLYPDKEIELIIGQRQNLRKNHTYTLEIPDAIEILKDLGIYGAYGLRSVPKSDITQKECDARAYLAGCFLAGGSINAPTRPDYHLELKANSEPFAQHLVRLLSRFHLQAKISVRRNRPFVYMKASDQIADFLRLVGANVSVMNFEDIRIQRDFVNSLQRLDNCEVANEMKTLESAGRQKAAIEWLIEHHRFDQLDEKLKVVAQLRLEHPEANLNELREVYLRVTGEEISKSGLQHRFTKLTELASKC